MALASLLLEVVSFFLVTIELYGVERLENLREKISRAGSAISVRMSAKLRRSDPLAAYATFTITLTAVGVDLVVLVLSVAQDDGGPTGILIMTTVLAVLVFVLLPSVTVLTYWTITSAVDASTFLLRKGKFEGYLVLLGAILFLTSKGLALTLI
jgi:hypothetical protein